MLTQETLNHLVDPQVIKQITAKATKKGFSNVQLCQPMLESQQNSLHFLVKSEVEDISFFEEARFRVALKEILQCDEIELIIENFITKQAKNEMIGKQCNFSSDNIEELKRFIREDLCLQFVEPTPAVIELPIDLSLNEHGKVTINLVLPRDEKELERSMQIVQEKLVHLMASEKGMRLPNLALRSVSSNV